MLKTNKGFTLIEMILVIVILGVLSVSVAPKFFDIKTSANTAQLDMFVGTIRDALMMKYAENLVNNRFPLYPEKLDPSSGGDASSTNPLFVNVLKEPVTSGWRRVGDTYTHLGTNKSYTYFKNDGAFNETVGGGGGIAIGGP